jgi:hypothetical protein
MAQAATVTWDAYNDFIAGPTDQAVTNRWQYLYNTQGDNNSGYTMLERWGSNGDGVAGDGWTTTTPSDTWHNELVAKDTVNGEIRVHPFREPSAGNPDLTATIGWLSPITGVVNAAFSLTDRDGNGGDGVGYWLYKSGDANDAYLKKGVLDNGPDWTSGVITKDNISVQQGDMLYLRVGARGGYGWDLTGVTFTVTSVPEPTSLALAGFGLFGLLAYAWRKRK